MIDWDALVRDTPPTRLKGTLHRMVEDQEQIATWSLVSSLPDQQLLEEMLDASKPPLPEAAQGLHYLLATPFRYPPLRHGSRFGRRHEPGIFYGARSIRPLLHEFAYYRFVLWTGMSVPPKGPILSRHTEFSATYSVRGHRLQSPPFSEHRDLLRSPVDCSEPQALGRALRAAAVEGFEYESARDPRGGINVGLFTPRGLISRRPRNLRSWLCETRDDAVVVSRADERRTWTFDRRLFEVEGAIPRPCEGGR